MASGERQAGHPGLSQDGALAALPADTDLLEDAPAPEAGAGPLRRQMVPGRHRRNLQGGVPQLRLAGRLRGPARGARRRPRRSAAARRHRRARPRADMARRLAVSRPHAFEPEHAPVFFGRTGAVASVLMKLRLQAEARRAFVLVVGMSGGGKSSLIRAGVLPLLTQPGVVGTQRAGDTRSCGRRTARAISRRRSRARSCSRARCRRSPTTDPGWIDLARTPRAGRETVRRARRAQASTAAGRVDVGRRRRRVATPNATSRWSSTSSRRCSPTTASTPPTAKRSSTRSPRSRAAAGLDHRDHAQRRYPRLADLPGADRAEGRRRPVRPAAADRPRDRPDHPLARRRRRLALRVANEHGRAARRRHPRRRREESRRACRCCSSCSRSSTSDAAPTTC